MPSDGAVQRMTLVGLRVETQVIGRLKNYLERTGPWPRGEQSRLLRSFIDKGVAGLERKESRKATEAEQ